MKKIIICIAGILIIQSANAQNETDALRYSQLTFGGTARSNSMAGAFGALGADFSTLSTNPAGIALFRKSEISFSPSVFSQSTTSTYYGQQASDSKLSFNFGNAGIVWTINSAGGPEGAGWRSFNLGFGYNRSNDFSNNINIQGTNPTSSLADVFVHNANGVNSSSLDAFNEGLAYNTFLIDNPGGGTEYVTYLPAGAVMQRKSIQTSGGMGETAISFGGNYAGKLYIGGTLGIPSINYTENSTYTEIPVSSSSGQVTSFQFNQYLHTTGTGINFKLGLIYRLADFARIGIAVHSPTSFSMHDHYSSDMSTAFKDSSFSSSSPSGAYNYNLVTPPRFIGSLGFVVAKKILIGAEYEYVDYSYAQLHSSDAGAFSDVNNRIKQEYKAVGNIRAGIEWKIVEPVAIRIGYAYYGNPYNSSFNIDASRSSYTAGIGFRGERFFVDLAYIMTQYKENYFLYDPTIVTVDPVNNSFSASTIMATFGFKF